LNKQANKQTSCIFTMAQYKYTHTGTTLRGCFRLLA